MTLSSMTGFASASGVADRIQWQWEIKSVNGKALDLRFRFPPGYDHLESTARLKLSEIFKRGNLQVSLSFSGDTAREKVAVNAEVLGQIVAIAEDLRLRHSGMPLQVEQLLSLRGVLTVETELPTEAEIAARTDIVLLGLEKCIADLLLARRAEGKRLHVVLAQQVIRIQQLTVAAKDCPARSPANIKARLAEQVSRLMETGANFDADRLHQEAILIATKADIQEEIDRLFGHVVAANALLESVEPVGRKFDFLAQEFNREANTLCSKALDQSLTTIGLDLKTTIDQMREQVQNIE